jgi:hypothetical protein
MGIISGGGGSGNTTAQVVASGKVLPVADAAGVTVDSTTYNDTIKGSGKLTTLVAGAEQGTIALALTGDLFPRLLLSSGGSLSLGDGSFDSDQDGAGLSAFSTPGVGAVLSLGSIASANNYDRAPTLAQVSPKFTTVSGALSTQQLVSATGAQLAAPGTTRDVETHTPVTFNPGVATTATCLVQISPDNVTYSTVCTLVEPVGTVLDGTVHDVTVRVPAGWWIKLTVNAQAVLGVTTYY